MKSNSASTDQILRNRLKFLIYSNLHERLEKMRPYIWADLCAESDSLKFLQWVRFSSNSKIYSPELEEFLESWIQDEQRHAKNFEALYSHLYGISIDQIRKILAARVSDFNTLAPFLEDEFSICVIIAYDEIATVKSYQQDIAFYDFLDKEVCGKFIRTVIKDEGKHFSNILKVIAKCHRDRLTELPSKLHQLMELDLSRREYRGTFVMDHAAFYFTPEVLSQCVTHILQYFRL